jgi:hypothetical protein
MAQRHYGLSATIEKNRQVCQRPSPGQNSSGRASGPAKGDVMQIDITRFGNLVVFDEQNHPVELGSLWQDKPAVIVFVRHFG